MQFGRTADDIFTMDFRYPLCGMSQMGFTTQNKFNFMSSTFFSTASIPDRPFIVRWQTRLRVIPVSGHLLSSVATSNQFHFIYIHLCLEQRIFQAVVFVHNARVHQDNILIKKYT